MSRTFRSPKIKRLCFRKPKTTQQRKENQKFLSLLVEEDMPVSNRHIKFSNHKNTILPSNRDDISISALLEIDYAKGVIWK